jgi:hypothetical protein
MADSRTFHKHIENYQQHTMLDSVRTVVGVAYTNPALNSNVSPFLGTAKAFRNRLTAISEKMKLQQRRGRASATTSMSREKRDGEVECERGVSTAPERIGWHKDVASRDTCCGGFRSVFFETVILIKQISTWCMWWPWTIAGLRNGDRK